MFSSDVILQIKKEQTKGRTAPENHKNTKDKPRFESNTLLQTLRPYYFLADISLSEPLFHLFTQFPSELHFSYNSFDLTSIYLSAC